MDAIACSNVKMMPCDTWEDPEVGAGDPGPLQSHKNIGFLSNTGPDPFKNYKATKPVFNFGSSLAHQ